MNDSYCEVVYFFESLCNNFYLGHTYILSIENPSIVSLITIFLFGNEMLYVCNITHQDKYKTVDCLFEKNCYQLTF